MKAIKARRGLSNNVNVMEVFKGVTAEEAIINMKHWAEAIKRAELMIDK